MPKQNLTILIENAARLSCIVFNKLDRSALGSEFSVCPRETANWDALVQKSSPLKTGVICYVILSDQHYRENADFQCLVKKQKLIQE